MNALDESSPASSLRRLPLLIRLAPELVNRFPALLASAQDAAAGVTGFLFGHVETESVFIQAFCSSAAFSDTQEPSTTNGARPGWHDAIASQAKSNPELAGLTLLGWLSARNLGGLLAADVEFHRRNFQKPTDVALLVRKEEGDEFRLELYSHNLPGAPAGEGDHWSAARLSITVPVASPIEVPMRSNTHDDLYMRAYDFRDPEDGSAGGWRDALSKGKKVLELIKAAKLPGKSSDDSPSPAVRQPEPLKTPSSDRATSPATTPAVVSEPSVEQAPLPAATHPQREKPALSPDQSATPELPTKVARESSPPPALQSVPFSVRLAPQFVNSLCAVLPGGNGGFERLDGLLFGMVEAEFSVLRVGRLFPPGLDLDNQSSYQAFLTKSKKDPQIAKLDLLGWLSVRNVSGLQTEDIAFHGSNFDKPNDIILIVRSEPAQHLVLEIYCRTSDGFFSQDRYRAGKVRVSTASPVISPVEVPVGSDTQNDDLVINERPDDPIEQKSVAGWKDTFTGKTKKAFEFLQSMKPEQRQATGEPAEPRRESSKADSGLLARLNSVTPVLPFGTGSGAAAAPARIAPERPETRTVGEEGKHDIRLEPQSPRPIELPEHKPAKGESSKPERRVSESGEATSIRPDEQHAPPEITQPRPADVPAFRDALAPGTEPNDTAVSKPAAPLSPSTELKPVAESKPLPEPVTESRTVPAVEPVAHSDLIPEPKPRAEPKPIANSKPIAEPRPMAEPKPVAETRPTGELQPAREFNRVAEPKAVGEDSGAPPPLGPAPEPSATGEPAFLIRQALTSDLSQYQLKPARMLPWRAMAAVFALAAAGTFGFIYLKTAGANGRLPGFLQAIWPSSGLDLKVSASGDRFQLSWNRTLPAVQTAREATLDINDGPSHHQIRLGNAELANGSVLYLPTTDDVIFRLEVHGATGQNATGSLRVVGNTQSASLRVSRPDENPGQETSVPTRDTAQRAAHGRLASTTQGSRVGPRATKSVRPNSGELVAANRAPQVQSSGTPDASVPPSTPVAPAKKTENAGPESPVSETPRANGGGTNALAENSTPPTTSAGSEAGRPSASNPTTPTGGANPSAPKPNSDEAAHVSEPARQDAPVRNDLVPNAPAQVPPSVPAKAPPQVGANRGQSLVTYRPPVPIKQVLPRVNALPPGVADTVHEVKVVVRVDESGRVIGARLVEGTNRVSSILGSAALNAAKQWIFEPASLHGKTIASDHTILFQFRR